MLFSFFLKRFFTTFLVFAFCLVLIFSTAHFFVRLSAANILLLIPIIFGIMLPMVLQYVVPIASGAAVYMVISDAAQRQENTILFFMRRSQWAIGSAVILYSLVITLLYGVLVLTMVPKSYSYGKHALINLAQQQFLHYQPNVVYEPMPGLYLIFQEKKLIDGSKVRLKNLFLSCKNKNDTYFFAAQDGVLSDTTFFLNHGSLLYQSGTAYYYSSFTQTSFDLKQLMKTYEKHEQKVPVKFLTCGELIIGSDNAVLSMELHKRFGQVLWQLLLPLIIFLGAFFLKKRKNIFFESFFLSGFLFLLMYMFLTIGQVIGGPLALVFFYLPSILILCCCLYRYKYSS